MNRNYNLTYGKFNLRYILLALAIFCFSGVVRNLESDAANDRYYQPSNTNVSQYRAQCTNVPVLSAYNSGNSDQPPCYEFQTKIQIYWTNGHYSDYSVRHAPAGYMSSVEEQVGMTADDLLDMSRKDIKPESGTGMAELWHDSVTRIELNHQIIKTYENPELNFAKDSRQTPNYGVWFWGGLGVLCVVILLATESARYFPSGVRYG